VAAPSGWVVTVTGNAVTATFAGDLVAGATARIVIATTVVGEPGDQATNSASVSVDGPIEDSDDSNNEDDVVVTIGELPVTGSDIARIALFGLLLLLAGSVFAAAGARRRRDRERRT
jgi:hypothetical protein